MAAVQVLVGSAVTIAAFAFRLNVTLSIRMLFYVSLSDFSHLQCTALTSVPARHLPLFNE